MNAAIDTGNSNAIEAARLLLQNNPKAPRSRFALTHFDQLKAALASLENGKSDEFVEIDLNG